MSLSIIVVLSISVHVFLSIVTNPSYVMLSIVATSFSVVPFITYNVLFIGLPIETYIFLTTMTVMCLSIVVFSSYIVVFSFESMMAYLSFKNGSRASTFEKGVLYSTCFVVSKTPFSVRLKHSATSMLLSMMVSFTRIVHVFLFTTTYSSSC